MKLVLMPGCTYDIGASAFAIITDLRVRTGGGRTGRPTHDSHLLGSLDAGCRVPGAEVTATDRGDCAVLPWRHDVGTMRSQVEARMAGDWRARVVASPVAPRHVTTRPLGRPQSRLADNNTGRSAAGNKNMRPSCCSVDPRTCRSRGCDGWEQSDGRSSSTSTRQVLSIVCSRRIGMTSAGSWRGPTSSHLGPSQLYPA